MATDKFDPDVTAGTRTALVHRQFIFDLGELGDILIAFLAEMQDFRRVMKNGGIPWDPKRSPEKTDDS
jgi:hypothetical protein